MVNIAHAVNTAQLYPVIGAVVSTFRGIKHVISVISHIAQFIFKFSAGFFQNAPISDLQKKAERRHISLAGRHSLIFFSHLLNVATLGFFYTTFRFASAFSS